MQKLGFGLMRLPQLGEGYEAPVDVERVKEMVDFYLKNGFTYFDTAAPYHNGNSEIAFREAVVKRYPREAYTITDKLSMFMIQKAADMQGFLNAQLERLGTDYIDYYLLHGLNVDTYRQSEQMDAFGFVQQMKAEGKIKHIGLSFHDKADLLDEILSKHAEMEYVQLQINYLDWDDESIQSGKCYEVATRHGKPVIVMEPIKGGSLVHIPEEAEELLKTQDSKMSIASWAIRYAASLDNVMVVLSGMSELVQVEDNIGFMKEFSSISDKDREVLSKAVGIIRSSITVPCTKCHYCSDGCPKKIAIPEYFSLYNNLKRFGPKEKFVAWTYYNSLAKDHGKASDCINCKKCERSCPQQLPIVECLKDVANDLESISFF